MSKDADGFETSVKIEMAGEVFSCSGIQVTHYNYLEIYTYEKWAEKTLPNFSQGEQIVPQLSLEKGRTTPPHPLTESDLIAKMDEQGIGTDATIHEHIKTVQDRGYAFKQGIYILPHQLGYALVETYHQIGMTLHRPDIRAKMENDMTQIAEGKQGSAVVLAACVETMSNLYLTTSRQQNLIK